MNSFKDIAYQILKEAGKSNNCSNEKNLSGAPTSLAQIPSPSKARTRRMRLGRNPRAGKSSRRRKIKNLINLLNNFSSW